MNEVRAALVAAVAADIRRRRRIRLMATIGAAAALLGVLASGSAAGSGWLFGAPAPPGVARDLRTFERQTPPPHGHVAQRSEIPLGKSVEVASGAGWTLYLLRTATHDCYSVAPNGGDLCGEVDAASSPVELLSYAVNADPRVKGDPSLAGRYGGGAVADPRQVREHARTEVAGAAVILLTSIHLAGFHEYPGGVFLVYPRRVLPGRLAHFPPTTGNGKLLAREYACGLISCCRRDIRDR